MSIMPGYRLGIAPHFHLPIDWSERLQLSSGLLEEDGRVVPRLPWRCPTEAELRVLIADVVELDSCVHLFHLPTHLEAQCEALFEQSMQNFGEFANQVAAYLDFKRLSPPTTMELMMCQPGQSSTNCDVSNGKSTGFRFTSGERHARQWGRVNLGVEPASVLLINLTADQLHSQIAPSSAILNDLSHRLLDANADYPAVRVQLAPGEGMRFPSTGLLVDGTTLGKEEPECWLVMFAD